MYAAIVGYEAECNCVLSWKYAEYANDKLMRLLMPPQQQQSMQLPPHTYNTYVRMYVCV